MNNLLLAACSTLLLANNVQAQESSAYKKNTIVSVSTTPLSAINPDRYLPIHVKLSNIKTKNALQLGLGYLWRSGSYIEATQDYSTYLTSNIRVSGLYSELEYARYLRGTKTSLGALVQYKKANCSFDAAATKDPVISGYNTMSYSRMMAAATYSFLMPGKMTRLNHGLQLAVGASYKQYISNGAKDFSGINGGNFDFTSPTGFFPYVHLRATVGLRF
jgi:hypothetical protein